VVGLYIEGLINSSFQASAWCESPGYRKEGKKSWLLYYLALSAPDSPLNSWQRVFHIIRCGFLVGTIQCCAQQWWRQVWHATWPLGL